MTEKEMQARIKELEECVERLGDKVELLESAIKQWQYASKLDRNPTSNAAAEHWGNIAKERDEWEDKFFKVLAAGDRLDNEAMQMTLTTICTAQDQTKRLREAVEGFRKSYQLRGSK